MIIRIACYVTGFVLWLPAVAVGQTVGRVPRINPDAPTSAYVNGLWYEADGAGVRFVAGDRYSIAGVFTARKPEVVERTVDLGSAYVVPPFGEAHNHNVDGPWTVPTAAKYLRQGIFYYKNPNDIAEASALGRAAFNKPSGLDVVSAHGGLSIAGGHPEELYRALAAMYKLDPNKLDGKAFFDVPTAEAVVRRWPEILKGRPDFIKLYLLDAAGEAHGKPAGLSAEPLRRAIGLAREAGLRTTVHVETAADLALAVEAGADESAHLPGYSWAKGLGANAYRISDELAKRMADRGFIVVTTTIVTTLGNVSTQEKVTQRRLIQALQIENLRKLYAARVPLAIGADYYMKTSLDEAKHLRKIGAFGDEELLRLWVETGPKSIFPSRSIGVLGPGHEASFLVLEGDPTKDFAQVERIKTRVKQGVVLGEK